MKQVTDIDLGRTALCAALDAYLERHPEEHLTIGQLRDFVEREVGCFDRSTTEGHITGSAWVVDEHRSSTLLTHHRKLNRWLQLGGHADGNVHVWEVALREAQEESGIDECVLLSSEIFDIDIHVIPARGDDPEHLHYDVRYIVQAAHTNYAVSHESHDLAWVPLDELERYTTEESMLRMARKWNALNNAL